MTDRRPRLAARSAWLCAISLIVLAGCGLPRVDRLALNPPDTVDDLRLQAIQLPPGFTIELVSDAVPSARAMTFGDRGTLFVGSKDAGKVYALRYDGALPAEPRVIIDGLQQPHGVAFRDGALYVAEISRILRFDDIEQRLDHPPEPVVVLELPRYVHHGMRTLRFAPDGALIFPVGAPCNICLPEPQFAGIYRLDLASEPAQPVKIAEGVRNTVGFDFHPDSGELWFTDNGRDFIGDNAPPDELNRLSAPGEQHFGYPHCHANGFRDPEFGLRADCDRFTSPVQSLGPHVAALGMRFYQGQQFPAAYRGRVFIAEHGSFNRSKLIGYRITEVTLDGTRPTAYRTFADGWLQNGKVWGRPVDVEVAPDGSLLVSDDQRGAVYRIRYVG